MALKAKVLGREALTRRLAQLAPNVEKYTAVAKLDAAVDLADAIRPLAPTGATLDYMESIEGDVIARRPDQKQVGIAASKDPDATGLFAKFTWAWLEFGTAPHSTAKGGGTVAGKAAATSMHPGTPAQPHIFPTYRAMRKKIKKRITAAVNKAVREAQKSR